MSFFDKLSELFCEDALLPFKEYGNGKRSVQLCEGNSCKVTVNNLPESTVVVELDKKFPEPKKLLQSTNGQLARCDFAIISVYQNRHYVVLIEMKEGNPSDKTKIPKQLTGGRCVIDYCGAILKNFHDEKKGFSDFEYRYVAFTQIRKTSRKHETRRSGAKHDTPSRYLTFRCQDTVQFGAILKG